MATNLFEWKKDKVETFREQIKNEIREGFIPDSHFFFTSDELDEIKEEVEIEDYSELHEDWEEVNLDLDDETLMAAYDQLHEAFDFVPNADGSLMDIEMEIDTSITEVNEELLEKLCGVMFAEEAEIEMLDEIRAKIVFKRSKGEVFKKKKCGKGMKLVGNKCIPQTGTQKAKERRKGIKLKRAFKAMGSGKKKKAQIKKSITKRRIRGRGRNLANTEN